MTAFDSTNCLWDPFSNVFYLILVLMTLNVLPFAVNVQIKVWNMWYILSLIMFFFVILDPIRNIKTSKFYVNRFIDS